ncbi:eCIS core domain-containing protein [Streptomyces goshikiensis]
MAERVRQSDVRTGAHRGGRAPRTPSRAQPRSGARDHGRDRGRDREPEPFEAPPGLAPLMASGAGNRAVGAYLRGEARSAGGQELAPPLRAEMESRLGADLSGVRLHTSTAAAESANALRARAFTVDQDVVFAAGEYRPGDPGGRALIAHELAHTVQQARGGPAPAGTDRTERAAAQVIDRGALVAKVYQGTAER